MIAEKRRRLDERDDELGRGERGGARAPPFGRHDDDLADSARGHRPFDDQRRQQELQSAVDSDVLHRRIASPPPRLPSVATFLHPRPSIGSAPPALSGARSLPPSPTASRPSVATPFGPTRNLSTPWEPPSHDQPPALEGDSAAFLPAAALMRTRRRFSPRSRLRASKRLAGQSLPPWSRPVGLSLASTVHAHALLPRDSDRFALRAHGSEQYPRFQRLEWDEHASSKQYRSLTGRDAGSTAMGSAGSEEKSSRYLREIDRRNILTRIERGEKQSALAKEFRVTRAAICNLNKHRELIMTRTCDDPLAKHPKRTKPSADEDSEEELGRGENADDSSENWTSSNDTDERKAPESQQEGGQVYLVDSRAVVMLSVLVRDRSTSELAFQQHCARLMVCLIEEAVAWMYTRQQQQPRRLGSYEGDREPTHFMLDEYYTRRPPCGVTVDEFGPLFLDKFRSIDPTWRCGAIEFLDPSAAASSGLPIRMDLPRALPACNVFLLLSFARNGGCRRLHQSVRILIDHGVVEELLCLVALGISSRTVHLLHAEFPRLRVATASIEREAIDSREEGRARHQREGFGANVGAGTRADGPTERLAKLAVSGG